LVLSEFAGASVELPEAVLVNPYSHRDMDANFDRALDMDMSERRQRLAAMSDRVRRWDVDHWAEHVRERFEGLSSLRGGLTLDAA
jgi:glucosylglycerol-phosphate synthase